MASEAQKFWISYLTLKENVYQAVPRDTMRSGFFQLKELSAADGEYTARFDAFYFADEDYTTEYEKATPNQKAVHDRLRAPFGKRVPDPAAPYDACDAPDDTGENAKRGLLPPVRMDRV